MRFTLNLQKPPMLQYALYGQRIDDSALTHDPVGTDGVAANFEYSMIGRLGGPHGFYGTRCSFTVNPGCSTDYLGYQKSGLIGTGSFEAESFEFRLFVSPSAATSILERRLLAEKIEAEYPYIDQAAERRGKTGPANGPVPPWITIDLDVINYRAAQPTTAGASAVLVDIVRLRCLGGETL